MKRNWTLIKTLLRVFKEDCLLNEDDCNRLSNLTGLEWKKHENVDESFQFRLLPSVYEHSNYSIYQLLTDARTFTKSIKLSNPELYQSILSDKLSSSEIDSLYSHLKNRHDFIIYKSRPCGPKKPKSDCSYYFIKDEYGALTWKYKD